MSELRVNRILNYDGNETHFTMSSSKLVVGTDSSSVNEIKGTMCPPDGASNYGDGLNRLRSSVNFTSSPTIAASYTSTSGMNQYYMINTSEERIVTLPAGNTASVGDWVTIVDVGTGEGSSGNASKKPITVRPNVADRIQGGSAGDDLIIDIDGQSVTLMWCGFTYDWRIVSS